MNKCTCCDKPLLEYILFDDTPPLFFCSDECRRKVIRDEDAILEEKSRRLYWSENRFHRCLECNDQTSSGDFDVKEQDFRCRECQKLLAEGSTYLDEHNYPIEIIRSFIRMNGSSRWFPLLVYPLKSTP